MNYILWDQNVHYLPSKSSAFEPYLLSDESNLHNHIPQELFEIICYTQQPWEMNFNEIYDN